MFKYDKAIKNLTKDFRLVVESVLTKMFKVDLAHADNIKRIYVDLNSCISIMFRHDDIADEELVRIVSDTIETFISDNIDDGMDIYFLYSVKPSAVHRDIFPEWCAERDARVSIVKSDFLKKLLVSLKIFSQKNKSIKIVNCGNVHSAMVVYMIDKSNKGRALVLSKDEVFRCIDKTNMDVYTGVEWISIASNMFNSEPGVFLSNPSELTPYYFTIRGCKRNEYSGYSGYGKIRSMEYVEKNKLKFKVDVEHPLKEFVDKHIALFRIHDMLLRAQQLGLNLEDFKGL